MADDSAHGDPRWGQVGRETKAEAILATLKLCGCADAERGTWLDIGCGSGGVAAALAGYVDRVVGIDPEPWERWSDFRSARSNLTFHAGSYRDLDRYVEHASIDVVVCNQVYEHVDDPVALLEAIEAVIKPGGVCYFAGPNLLWPVEPHVHWPFVHWLPRRFAQSAMCMLGSRRAGDLDAWSSDYFTLTRMFRHAGFAHQVAIRERAIAGSRCGEAGLAVKVLAALPRPLSVALAPLLPAFVFVLRKTSTHR